MCQILIIWYTYAHFANVSNTLYCHNYDDTDAIMMEIVQSFVIYHIHDLIIKWLEWKPKN